MSEGLPSATKADGAFARCGMLGDVPSPSFPFDPQAFDDQLRPRADPGRRRSRASARPLPAWVVVSSPFSGVLSALCPTCVASTKKS